MESDGQGRITGLLKAWVGGNESAREELIPLVYAELRQLARRYRRRAGAGETLQTTALVNEAYLRLVAIDQVNWNDRVHFFAVSAQLMRRILVDSARARRSAKRGGGAARVDPALLDLDWLPDPSSERVSEWIDLDSALNELEKMDPRRARVVELRVFGGLTVAETAPVLNLSPQSVMRDWKLAKAWLLRELSNRQPNP